VRRSILVTWGRGEKQRVLAIGVGTQYNKAVKQKRDATSDAAAPFIINGIQQRTAAKQAGPIPTFFPIPNWVQPAAIATGSKQALAFAGYGISQYSCGYTVAGLIAQIWNNTATPQALGVQTTFNFMVSKSAAATLNITLPTYLPALGAQLVT
jgi:hypothetical protein